MQRWNDVLRQPQYYATPADQINGTFTQVQDWLLTRLGCVPCSGRQIVCTPGQGRSVIVAFCICWACGSPQLLHVHPHSATSCKAGDLVMASQKASCGCIPRAGLNKAQKKG